MSNTDLIALAAVAVTAIALVANFFAQRAVFQKQGDSEKNQAMFLAEVQRQLESIQEEFALAREQRQFVVPPNLGELKEVEDWVNDAYQLGLQYKSLGNKGVNAKAVWEKGYARIGEQRERWFGKYHRCYTLGYRLGKHDKTMIVPPMRQVGKIESRKPYWNEIPSDLAECIQRLSVAISLCDMAANNDLNINVMYYSAGLVEQNLRFATTEIERIRNEIVAGQSKPQSARPSP